MIAREKNAERPDIDGHIYARLSAPIPKSLISWRIDGKPVAKNGKFVARFVAYIEANTVRERLDAVVPGEWDETLELLPTYTKTNREGEAIGAVFAFKCRLQILGVIREDVGQGSDYKAAATDAFKRAAVRFGIGHELYSYEQNWVQVDGDGKFARPVEDPNDVYERRQAQRKGGGGGGGGSGAERVASGVKSANTGTGAVAPHKGDERSPETAARQKPAPTSTPPARQATPPNGTPAIPSACPTCGGELWDNRAKKASGQFAAKAPDFKCKDRQCDTPVWLDAKKGSKGKQEYNFGDELPGEYDETQALTEEDEIPF